MSAGSYPNEISWSLACNGAEPITGGAPYSATHAVLACDNQGYRPLGWLLAAALHAS